MTFRGSIPHPMQSLCTLRNRCRQRPRNTRYQADATPYLGRTFTGWIAPALRLAHLFNHFVRPSQERWRYCETDRSAAFRLITSSCWVGFLISLSLLCCIVGLFFMIGRCLLTADAGRTKICSVCKTHHTCAGPTAFRVAAVARSAWPSKTQKPIIGITLLDRAVS